MVTKAERWGEINWKFGTNIHTLLYIKEITNKDLLYSTANYIQYLITYNGKEYEKIHIHICVYIYTYKHN